MAKTKDPQHAAAAIAIKAQREVDAAQAMREYRAEEVAVRANTARLRAERLAREAKAVESAEQSKAPKKTAKSTLQRIVP